MTAALEGCEWSAERPGRTLPPGKTRYPFYRRLGGPQGRSGRAEYLVPTGIRSRTVQPVVSRYTDWATRPTLNTHITYIRSWKRKEKTYRDNGGKVPLIFNFGARCMWVVNFTPWPFCLPGKNPGRCTNWKGRGPGGDVLEAKRKSIYIRLLRKAPCSLAQIYEYFRGLCHVHAPWWWW